MNIYTVGFTKWTAAEFFGNLRNAGIKRLIDVRLHNVSQLAGYTKRDDLKFFLEELLGAEYVHQPLLAPTKEMLSEYRRTRDWEVYSERFLNLMEARKVEHLFDRLGFLEPTALLCSEHTQEYCHRRLVVEYLNEKWGDVRSLPI